MYQCIITQIVSIFFSLVCIYCGHIYLLHFLHQLSLYYCNLTTTQLHNVQLRPSLILHYFTALFLVLLFTDVKIDFFCLSLSFKSSLLEIFRRQRFLSIKAQNVKCLANEFSGTQDSSINLVTSILVCGDETTCQDIISHSI